MKLRDLIEQTQIRDRVIVKLVDGEYVKNENYDWTELKGYSVSIFKTKRGTDFNHILTTDEIPNLYLDYEVYCISGTTSKGLTVIDIKKGK